MRRVLCLLSAVIAVWGARAQSGFSEILFVERSQYALDHHNTATMFQRGEINSAKFAGGPP